MDIKATNFEFASYKFEPDKKRIFFNYKTEFDSNAPLFFTETIIFPQTPDLTGVPSELIEKLLQSLHVVLGISYYKFYCAPKIKIEYSFCKKEADFWNTIYKKGLGEFFYRNGLDPELSPKFPFDKKVKPASHKLEKNKKFLVAISGGKDSIVSMELLKKQGIDITTFFVQTQKKSDIVESIISQSGTDSLKIERFLDAQVFQKHKYDGHIPISAIYAFLGVLSAVLYKYSYFVVSNEYSSNFGNLEYKGVEINHQWSKSYEFETMFQNYIGDFINRDIKYFSLLRPFYEIRIAKMFSRYEKYFPYFSSCNRNFKIMDDGLPSRSFSGGWCGECPKCAFVFLLLSSFLEKQKLINIFGKNLFEDEKILPLFKDILGFGKLKPFDCVGAFDESRAALYLAKEKFKDALIIKGLLPKIKNPEKLVKKVFKVQKSNVPDYLKFLGMEKAAILGYGKEGEVTEKYLKNNFSELKVDILDQKIDKNYLKKQDNYDILVKTPVIPKEKIKIPYTTATNIFFSKIKETGNKIIGVTGTKGKSTTSSLICEILKSAGKKARFSGNIGNPMLESLLGKIDKNGIFILELSSYQLSDIKYSPDIAVVINLFPEHLDHHGSKEKYFEAKKNIINFQSQIDILIYNGKYKELINWAKNHMAKTIDFSKEKLLPKMKTKLLGEHNKDNIRAAISVAKKLGAKDSVIKSAVENFKGLPHRLEFVGEFNGIKFYDDAISTTPESTIMAIKSLPKIDTIFLGGEDRGYDFSQLEKIIKKYKINNIVLFPESGKKILKSKKGFNILKTSSMEEAVRFAYKHTKKGSICLLSCASPSYSLWRDFKEKGDLFQQFVKKLK